MALASLELRFRALVAELLVEALLVSLLLVAVSLVEGLVVSLLLGWSPGLRGLMRAYCPHCSLTARLGWCPPMAVCHTLVRAWAFSYGRWSRTCGLLPSPLTPLRLDVLLCHWVLLAVPLARAAPR